MAQDVGVKVKQFIAPKVLLVNEEPAPCMCGEKTICEYCVQANLVLWEREQHPEEETQAKLIKDIEQRGIRKTARLAKIRPNTISDWIQKKKVPPKYIKILNGVSQT